MQPVESCKVQKHVLAQWPHYVALMRLKRPVGIWLLMWPCFWGVAMAHPETGAMLGLLALFLIGSMVMRSAGCVINDMADREFDAKVERTKDRPLASGAVSMREASALLAVLLLIGLGVAVALGQEIVLLSLAWMPLVVAYPFMKRITWWPQMFLGITFNAGVIFGWMAVMGEVSLPALVLYLGAIGWTLGYDTIYAHQDTADDEQIGVKSTALLFGEKTYFWVAGFYQWFVICIVATLMLLDASRLSFVLLLPLMAHLTWQICTVRLENPAHCQSMFISNQWVGAWLFLVFLVA